MPSPPAPGSWSSIPAWSAAIRPWCATTGRTPSSTRGNFPARTVAEIAATIEGFAPGVPALRLPLLVMAGTADRIVPPSGSVMVHDRAGSPDRTLRLYEGLYHELFNEPERRVVLGDVAAWLDARTVPRPAEAQTPSV